MEVVEAVPYSAWEQAVFVVLVIVFAIALLAWFTKQSDKWQAFIARMEEQWRAFNREQRKENNDCMQGLTDVIQQLLLQVREMRDESNNFYANFQAHDLQAKEILDKVAANGKPVTKPAPRKATPKE